MSQVSREEDKQALKIKLRYLQDKACYEKCTKLLGPRPKHEALAKAWDKVFEGIDP